MNQDPIAWFESLCAEFSKRPKEFTRILEEFRESEGVFKTSLVVLQAPASSHLAKFHALSSVQYALLVKWETISPNDKQEWLNTIEQFIFQAVTQQYPPYITNKLIQVFCSLQKRQWLLSSFEEKQSLFNKLLQFFPAEFPINQPMIFPPPTYDQQVMSTKLGINLILSLLEEFSKRSSADIGIYGLIYIQRKDNFEKSFLPSIFPFFVKLLTQQIPLWTNLHQHLQSSPGNGMTGTWLDIPSNFRFSCVVLPLILKTLSELITWQYNEKSTSSTSNWADSNNNGVLDPHTIYYPLASYASPLLEKDFIQQLFFLLHILVQYHFARNTTGGNGKQSNVTNGGSKGSSGMSLTSMKDQQLPGNELIIPCVQELQSFLTLLSLISGDIFQSPSPAPHSADSTNSRKLQYGMSLLSNLFPLVQPHITRKSLSLLTIDADDFHCTAMSSMRTFYLEFFITMVHNILFNNSLATVLHAHQLPPSPTVSGANTVANLYDESMQYIQCIGYIMQQLLEEIHVITGDIHVTLLRSNFQDIDFFHPDDSVCGKGQDDYGYDDEHDSSSAHLYHTWRFELILSIMDIFVIVQAQFPIHPFYMHSMLPPGTSASITNSSSSSSCGMNDIITSCHYHFYSWLFQFIQQTFPIFFDIFVVLSLVDTLQDMDQDEDEDDENIYLSTIENCIAGITALGKMNAMFVSEYLVQHYLVPTINEWEKVVQTSRQLPQSGGIGGGGGGAGSTSNATHGSNHSMSSNASSNMGIGRTTSLSSPCGLGSFGHNSATATTHSLLNHALLSPGSTTSTGNASYASVDLQLCWSRKNIYCLEKLRLTIMFLSSIMVDNYTELIKKSSSFSSGFSGVSGGNSTGGTSSQDGTGDDNGDYRRHEGKYLYDLYLSLGELPMINDWILVNIASSLRNSSSVSPSTGNCAALPNATTYQQILSAPQGMNPVSFNGPQHQQLMQENRSSFVQIYSVLGYLLNGQMSVLNGTFSMLSSTPNSTPLPSPMNPNVAVSGGMNGNIGQIGPNKDCVSPYLLQIIYRFYSVTFLYYLDLAMDEYSVEYQQVYSFLPHLVSDDIQGVIENVVNSWIVLLQHYPLELDTVKTSCEAMMMLITRHSKKYLLPVLNYPAIQYLLSQYTAWYQYVYTFYTTCHTSAGNGIYGGGSQPTHSQSILPGLTPEGWMMITEVLSRMFIQTKQTHYFRTFCETLYKVMEVTKPNHNQQPTINSCVSRAQGSSSSNHIINAEQMMIKKQLLACLTGLAKSPMEDMEENLLHTVYHYFWVHFYGNPSAPSSLLMEGEVTSLDEFLHLYTALLIQYTEYQLATLTDDHAAIATSLYTAIAILFYTYSSRFQQLAPSITCALTNVSSVMSGMIQEHVTFIYESCTSLLNIMNALALKDFLVSTTELTLPQILSPQHPQLQQHHASTNAMLPMLKSVPGVLYYGLQIILPFITEEFLMNYFVLSEKYYSYLSFLSTTYMPMMMQWIGNMKEEEGLQYWRRLLNHLLIGVVVVDSSIARTALQALQTFAINQMKVNQQKQGNGATTTPPRISKSAPAVTVGLQHFSHYQALLQAFQQLLSIIFACSSATTNKLTPDRLDAVANTLITFIVMDANAFQQLTSEYLSTQTVTNQGLLRQYLTTLITDRQVNMTSILKPNRQLFALNFRDFINHIKSLGLTV